MASKRKRGEVWEYTVKRAGVLPKPIYLTFSYEAEGDAYCRNLEALLAKGIVPTQHQESSGVRDIAGLVRVYERDAHPSKKDQGAFGPVLKALGATPLTAIDAKWVDLWITEMKRIEKLAPATIRARVGALARAADWGIRKGFLTLPDHPFRTLPDGYAQYTKTDTALAGVERVDVERDRRLEPGEHEKILAALAAGVLPRKQRPLKLEHVDALRCLYVLALESAMRLRELFTLTLDQVDVPKRTIFLERTKNGDKRQVPLSTVAVATVKDYLAARPKHIEGRGDGVLFPWWDGTLRDKSLDDVSDLLSKLFHNKRSPGIFEAAGCVGLGFHDLRHEATSRLFERTTLSEAQIMKITGHRSHRMMMRYANLRGSDLAERLW